ncbi:MAG: hypothetical protein ACPL7A_03395 [Anaerolineales bacterium]
MENLPKPTPILPDPAITRISHPTPTDVSIILQSPTSPRPSQSPQCSDLMFRILPPLEFEKDLFEHHAKGIFFILHIEAINQTDQVIQVFSEDYHLHYFINAEEFDLTPQAAATNYLYIRRGENFYQDKIAANATWHTYLAFDVDTKLTNWLLIIRPGSKYQSNSCEYVLKQNGN